MTEGDQVRNAVLAEGTHIEVEENQEWSFELKKNFWANIGMVQLEIPFK